MAESTSSSLSLLCHYYLNLVESKSLRWDASGTVWELLFFLVTFLLPFEIVAKLHLKGEEGLNRKALLLGRYSVSDLKRGSEYLARAWNIHVGSVLCQHSGICPSESFGSRLVGQLMNSGTQPLGFSVAPAMPTALFSIISLCFYGFFFPEKETCYKILELRLMGDYLLKPPCFTNRETKTHVGGRLAHPV